MFEASTFARFKPLISRIYPSPSPLPSPFFNQVMHHRRKFPLVYRLTAPSSLRLLIKRATTRVRTADGPAINRPGVYVDFSIVSRVGRGRRRRVILTLHALQTIFHSAPGNFMCELSHLSPRRERTPQPREHRHRLDTPKFIAVR